MLFKQEIYRLSFLKDLFVMANYWFGALHVHLPLCFNVFNTISGIKSNVIILADLSAYVARKKNNQKILYLYFFWEEKHMEQRLSWACY